MDNLDSDTTLAEYMGRVFNKEYYVQRSIEATKEGKTAIIAAICPKCMYQLQSESLGDDPYIKRCKCSTEIIPDMDLVNALAPEEWGLTAPGHAGVGRVKW